MTFSPGTQISVKVISLLLALASAAGAGQELARAREAAALGSEARALEIALQGLKQAPQDSELFLYAVELLPEKPSTQARALAAVARAGQEKESGNYAWHLGICKTMRVSGRSQAAVSHCRKALELEPILYLPYKELGLTYAAAGNSAKAAEILQRGADVAPLNYQAHYQLGKALEKSGKAPGSRAEYTQALKLAQSAAGLDSNYYQALITAGLKRLDLRHPQPGAAAKKPPPPGKELQYAACLAKFRDEIRKDNLLNAVDLSAGCLKLIPGDPQLAAELAPLLVRLGHTERGAKEYERAAALYGPDKTITASLRSKAAETWLKTGNSANAAAQYRLAAKANPADMKPLHELAKVLQSRSDFKAELETLEVILKKEPGNTLVRTRVEELKTDLMSTERILEELKLRRMASENKLTLQPEDIKLFKAVRAAEISGGVDYILARVLSAKGLYLENTTSDGTIKVLLTDAGYKTYSFHATRDAIAFFERQKIALNDIFKLRTLKGEPLFDAAGRITVEGAEAWRKAQTGARTWLLPYEAVPESPKAIQANKDLTQAQAAGYREISEPEFLWLLRYTNCPQDIMQSEPLNLKTLNDGARLRYLLCSVANSACMTPANRNLPSAIEEYRDGKDSISDSKTSTAFFGTGAVKKHKLCENGKLWAGE